MIKNRLAVLLAERNLKITQVAKDTGISRNTITSTAQNDSKMIQLQTIDVLCNYLDITPTEFFEYHPALYDISIYIEKVDLEAIYGGFFLSEVTLKHFEADIYIDIKYSNNRTYSTHLEVGVNKDKRSYAQGETFKDASSQLELIGVFRNDIDQQDFVERVWRELSIGFQNDFYEDLKGELLKEIEKYLLENSIESDEIFILGSAPNLYKAWKDDIKDVVSSIKFNFSSLVNR